MSEYNQTPRRYLSQTSKTILSASEPTLSGRTSSIPQVSHSNRSPQRQIPRPRSTDYSRFANNPLGLHTALSSDQDSYNSYKHPLSIAENCATDDFESSPFPQSFHYRLGIINSKRPSRPSRDNAGTGVSDIASTLAEGSHPSKPKYELVFARTLRIPERDRDRKIVSPASGPHLPPSRIPYKPFRCPKANCSRTFSNENGLKYHTKHGYCNQNSLDLSRFSVSSPITYLSPAHPEDTSTPSTSNPIADEPSSQLSAPQTGRISIATTKKSNVWKDRGSFVRDPSSAHGSTDIGSGVERGRSKHRLRKATSVPNPHKSDLSLQSRLIAFPPPPPFASRNDDPEKQCRQEQEHRDQERLRRRKDPERTQNKNEWDVIDKGHYTFGDSHLARSLSSSRPSERDPVLNRPYSRPSSRPPSIHTSPGTPPWSTPTSFSSSFLRPTSKSFRSSYSSIDPLKLTTSSRLANPLPLPPDVHLKFLLTAREREWGKIGNRNSTRGDPSVAFPKTPSPQIPFRRFSRPPSPRPSSIPSSMQSFSRKSSISSLSRPSSSPSSLRYSPNSSPNLSAFSPTFIRSSTSPSASLHLSDPSPPPPPLRSTRRLSILPNQQKRPLSWREKVRQGFWNRRGDFLTHDGFVVYAPPDRTYPDDLSTYPAEIEGYQDHELEFTPYVPRPELPESLPRHGRPPERPYDSFIIYVYK